MILTISSNDGWQKIVFREIERVSIEGASYLELRIEFYSNYWSRKEMLNNEFNNLVEDIKFEYKQHCVRLEDWNNLLNKLNEWESNSNVFSHRMEGEPNEFILVEISDNDDKLICSQETPLLKFVIVNPRYTLEYKMIIDQSSIHQEILYN